MTVVRHQITKTITDDDGPWSAEVIVSAVRTLLRWATDDATPQWPTFRVRVHDEQIDPTTHTFVVRASVDVTVHDHPTPKEH